MALDLATVTGYAIGRAGSIPRSGSVRLRYPDQERGVAPFNLMAFLRDRFVLEKPDLIAVEDMMGAPAIKSADAAVAQIMLHGVIEAMARINAIRLDRVHRATLLKHFIGRGRTGERATTKRAVIEQAKLLGYVPADCRDDNRCDAVAVWDWASAKVAGTPRKSTIGLPADLTIGGIL